MNMDNEYRQLLERISAEHGLSVEQIERSVSSKRGTLFGLLSKGMVARLIQVSWGLHSSLASFLAAGARHVSGSKLSDALAAASNEAERGNLSTFGYWAHKGDTPGVIASRYLQAIDAIADSRLDSSISIKVDQVEYDRELLHPVFRHAASRHVRVHFDAQPIPTADRTHELVREAIALGTDVSATLPSRWERSVKDAEMFLDLGIPMRIVKGQGGDPGNPKIDPRRSFLALVNQVRGRALHVGVATHDRRVAEPALDLLLATNTPCSLEQLRSLPRLDFLAKKRGIPVRAYVAYGRFGLPYSIGELKRRPAIIGWILRDAIERHRSAS